MSSMSVSSPLPTLCLNMIVKNESHIIERLLSSVVNIIDTYCIEDTGSTDDTPTIITNFFEKHSIKGKIVHEKFINFSYNRTHAYQQCSGISDYVIFLDADMIFTTTLSKEELQKRLAQYSVHHIFQGSKSSFHYKNVRIVKNNMNAKYVTPTHEYFSAPPDATYNTFDVKDVFIDDRGDGGSKSNKFERDILLLSKELEENPDDVRCTFYLANSYRDNVNIDKAIEYYEKRIKLGGWVEEQWYSAYMIGNLYFHNKKEIEKGIYYWILAYNIYPNRAENLYELVKYYREKEFYIVAYTFYQLARVAQETNAPWDFLFTKLDIYEYKLDYEFTILGYYYNKGEYSLRNSCMKVLQHRLTEDWVLKNTYSNYKFYTETLSKYALTIPDCNAEILAPKLHIPEFVSSTPSLLYDEENHKLFVCTRHVNYSINEKGDYVNQSNIVTHNSMKVIDVKNSHWKTIDNEQKISYDESLDNRYVGIEDVRIFLHSKGILYTGNRGLSDNRMAVEFGSIVVSATTVETKDSRILTFDQHETPSHCEKNWVLFENSNKELKSVYSWSPLQIGNIEDNLFKLIRTDTNVPKFFKHVRGSTHGVSVGENEVWFLCHLVSYEDRRYYYHLIIVLDSSTYELKRYTPLFTFEKEKVEYSLGFVYFKEKKQLLFGYSTLDRETKYMCIGKHIIEEMMMI